MKALDTTAILRTLGPVTFADDPRLVAISDLIH
jgi:hypothetical protein